MLASKRRRWPPLTELKTWFRDNATLVYFLIARALAGGAAVLSITVYMTNLEARVVTLETRGSPHLAEINTRLTVLEGMTKDNKETLGRIVDIMSKELHIQPGKD